MIEQVADRIDPVGLRSLDTAFICYHGDPFHLPASAMASIKAAETALCA
jgi:hypothetical protein